MSDNVPEEAPSWADHVRAENDPAELEHGAKVAQTAASGPAAAESSLGADVAGGVLGATAVTATGVGVAAAVANVALGTAAQAAYPFAGIGEGIAAEGLLAHPLLAAAGGANLVAEGATAVSEGFAAAGGMATVGVVGAVAAGVGLLAAEHFPEDEARAAGIPYDPNANASHEENASHDDGMSHAPADGWE